VKIIRLAVPDNPVPKARQRITAIGGHARSYTPKDSKDLVHKAKIRNAAKCWYKDEPYEGAVMVDIIFWMQRPKSHYRTGKFAGQIKDSMQMAYHTSKPDRDNLDKLVLDSLSGIIIKDDAQVVGGKIWKEYADHRPETIITITFLEE
jgi:Holliday junction resolvase RusA-like endonuclease